MRLIGRIPVEPLGEERLTNIERRVVAGAGERIAAPVRGSRWALSFATAAVAAGIAGLVGWRLHDTPTLAPSAAPPPVAVQTETGRSTLDIGDATIASDPAASFEVTRPGGGVLVAMKRGRIELSVEKRHDRPPLIVRAGDTDVEVVGTRFSVDYDGRAGVEVRVTEGKVKVSRGSQVVYVAAGSEWTSTGAVVASAPATPPEPAPVVVASVAAPAPTIVAVTPPVTLHDHVVVVPDQQSTHVAPRRRAETAAARVLEPVARATPRTAIAGDPYVELKVAIKKQPLAFDPNLDGAGDAAAEIAKLKRVAYSPTTLGADASAALYKIAVLLHKPLKQDAEAMRTLDIYRRRFSRGRELDAALWLRVRILCAHAIDDDCRQAAYGYQHGAPTGAAADVAVRITNVQ
jgi:hypothetical protein